MLHTDDNNKLEWYQKPVLWRLILAMVVLGYGHKLFGDEPAVKQPKAETKAVDTEWSLVISPDNPDAESTLTTFTLDSQTGIEKKQESKPYIETSEPDVIIAPENTDKAPTGDALPPASVEPCPEKQKPAFNYSREDYVRIYNSIPFSRSLYNANPTYRHDATMEIILGQPKPVTIVKKEYSTPSVSPYQTYPYSHYLNPYYDPWYLSNDYPNLRSTPIYSLWRPYQPFFTGAWSYHSYQSGVPYNLR